MDTPWDSFGGRVSDPAPPAWIAETLMTTRTLLITLALVSLSCGDAGYPVDANLSAPQNRNFNLLFRYGVKAHNELNTFCNSYTKDLILDGTITTRMILSRPELDSIEAKLVQIDLFSYPDTFVVQRKDSLVTFFTPYQTYIFKVFHQHSLKNCYWENCILSDDDRATRLRSTITYIRSIIESRREYKQLPPPRGGYL